MKVKEVIEMLSNDLSLDDEIAFDYVTKEDIETYASNKDVAISAGQVNDTLNYVDECQSGMMDDVEFYIYDKVEKS